MTEINKKIKRFSASLTGGFVVGFAVITLVMLITGEVGAWQLSSRWGTSLVIGVAMGAWVRMADL